MNNKNVTTFYIVRHGETDWNVQKKIQGQKDIPLNTHGKHQAKSFGESLQHVHFDFAFSSDLLRAKRTAEIIALDRNLQVQTTKLLRERAFGELEGQSSSALFAYFKLLHALSHNERLLKRPAKDAENDEELTTRLLVFLRETAITNPGKTILVATHGGPLRMLLIHLGYMTYLESDNLHVANTGHVILKSDGVEFFIEETKGLLEKGQSSYRSWI